VAEVFGDFGGSLPNANITASISSSNPFSTTTHSNRFLSKQPNKWIIEFLTELIVTAYSEVIYL